MAVRVYEFAKKHNISNKDVLAALKKGGFEAQSHMSVLSDESLIFLESTFVSKTLQPIENKPQNKAIKTDDVLKSQKAVNSKPDVVEKAVEKATEKNVEALKQQDKEIAKEQKITEPIALYPMTVGEFAEKISKPASEVIVYLLKQKIVANKNQILPENLISSMAAFFGVPVMPKQEPQRKDVILEKEVHDSTDKVVRLPIVVVIGHVDHGKTTLLDYIRKTKVASKEKGGITQHLGAYEVDTDNGNLIFLDTPGHEAFSLMRVRGIKVADIAILVIAADDGVMPQTIEALNAAKSANIPIVVAINKIDKASPSQVESVKQSLTQYGLIPEEWGGQAICMPISAKTGKGVNELLDVLLLQSQMMDLYSQVNVPAKGYILEAKIEKGRGPVATVICQHGILKVGDYFFAGKVLGRVNSLVDSFGRRVQQVKPSIPVQVSGFDELPDVGDIFQAVPESDRKKAKEQALTAAQEGLALKAAHKENALNIIIKADNVSSCQALLGSIGKIRIKDGKEFFVISSGVGNINESDVTLAKDTGSLIIGLHIKVEPNALLLTNKLSVKIKTFDIIYKLLENLEEVATASKQVKMILKKIGEAVVLKVFDIKGLGVIAGALVKSGKFSKDGKIYVWRGKHKIGEGKIQSLQRDKKAVKEVNTGFECAFLIANFSDWQVDDRAECYLEVPAV